jgi:hypothetical protein
MSPLPSITAWDARPVDEFAGFVVTPAFVETSSRQRDAVSSPISAESAAVYKFMFGKFAAWMLERGLRMSTVNASDLQEFVLLSTRGKRDLNSKIAYRYLRLLERVFDYLERAPNPARQAIVASDPALMKQDAPMTALDPGTTGTLPGRPARRARSRARQRRRLEAPARPRDAGGDGAGRSARGRGDRPAGRRESDASRMSTAPSNCRSRPKPSTAPATSTACCCRASAWPNCSTG